jgi:hypothetical protein
MSGSKPTCGRSMPTHQFAGLWTLISGPSNAFRHLAIAYRLADAKSYDGLTNP